MEMDVRLRKAISATGYSQLMDIQFKIENSTVMLFGTVDSFYAKQLAQESIRNVVGDFKILNLLEVRSNDK